MTHLHVRICFTFFFSSNSLPALYYLFLMTPVKIYIMVAINKYSLIFQQLWSHKEFILWMFSLAIYWMVTRGNHGLYFGGTSMSTELFSPKMKNDALCPSASLYERYWTGTFSIGSSNIYVFPCYQIYVKMWNVVIAAGISKFSFYSSFIYIVL